MTERPITQTPRVGLTLKRLDENKPAFWMADYRHLIYPEYHQKMKDLIILSMIHLGVAASTIAIRANCKITKIEELQQDYSKGLKQDQSIAKLHKENMKASDWAEVYGLSKKLFGEEV